MCKLVSHELDRQNDQLCAWMLDKEVSEEYLIAGIQDIQKQVLEAEIEPEMGAATLYGLRAFLAAIIRKQEVEEDND